MTIKCCIHTCKNIYKSKGRKIGDENNNETLIFHRFPRNKGQKARWINSIRNINGSTWEPKDPLFVCSEHFNRFSWELIREDGKRKLKIGAIPSVFKNNLPSKPFNEHTYSMPLQDISNRSDIVAQLSIKKKKLRSLCDNDHTYIRRPICCNDGNVSEIVISSVEKTIISKGNKENEADPLQIETSSATIQLGYNDSDVKRDCLDVCTSTVNSVERSALNNLDLMQISAESEQISVHSYTMTQDDTLSDWLTEVKKDISTQTTKEQNTDLKITSLMEKNEQLKKHLTELDKILNKILRQNEVLRNSNKNMSCFQVSKQLDTWKNIKKREEGILKTFNKDQKEALRRKNSQGVKWESATLKQALILKLKCGSSGYEEVRKLFPLLFPVVEHDKATHFLAIVTTK